MRAMGEHVGFFTGPLMDNYYKGALMDLHYCFVVCSDSALIGSFCIIWNASVCFCLILMKKVSVCFCCCWIV